MLTANQIRAKFLDFFRERGHEIVPSAPIVMKDDPTLMFTNAGMNQFKAFFLEQKKSSYPAIADTQKCLRVSGKHNDLEEVGVDTYHHTMFEMLGNWSFNDYFKEEAIEWSWKLLTDVYEIDPSVIYVTIFEGDEKSGIPRDAESFEIWKKYLAEDRIIEGSRADNFWEMGETGPCGPSTEIHIDCRDEEEKIRLEGRKLVNQDHPQVIEIWNNVFIQYNRKKDQSLEALKGRYVDTGMGLERLVRILQQKKSNYDTDLFMPTIERISRLTGKEYMGLQSKSDIAFRVIADHVRALVFTIADGQIPSNTGAGYVIRRILRRAVRYYYSYLDRTEPLMFELVGELARQYIDVFPEVNRQKDLVTKIIREEEDAFLRTLEKGLKKLDEITQNESSAVVSGKAAFELYDTFGFPLDLTKLILADYDKVVDEQGFDKEMAAQKSRSRNATALDTGDWVSVQDENESVFVGYQSLDAISQITRYRKVKDAKNEFYQFVLDTTPFYAEGGGQVGDQGIVNIGDKKLRIFDTKKENNQIIHFTKDDPSPAIDQMLNAEVHSERRRAIECNHTATHLLHEALRHVLGDHVEQKGSLVNEKMLRFDFSHFQKVSDEEIQKIEERVTAMILAAHPVEARIMSREQADEIGAMALFGEKYGEEVRVVMVDDTPSRELCGGTHVKNTSEITIFKIISESSVAAGVRRVEALTSNICLSYIEQELKTLKQIQSIIPSKNLVKDIQKLQEQNNMLSKELDRMKQKELSSIAKDMSAFVDKRNSIDTVTKVLEGYSVDDLKKIAFSMKNELSKYLLVLASVDGPKYNVLVMIDPETQEANGWDASQFLREKLAPEMKGGGGGQKFLATGAGKHEVSEERLGQLRDEVFFS